MFLSLSFSNEDAVQVYPLNRSFLQYRNALCRWLIIHQHSFDCTGYIDFSENFRRIEVEEYKRDIAKGQYIKYNGIDTLHVAYEYPFVLANTEYKDSKIMSSMLLCETNKKLLLRGYSIEEQISQGKNKEYNHDGCMNVPLL